jgi:hypothetical protein
MGILYKTFKTFRTVFCLAFLAIIASPAMAQDTASLYIVQNINVDISAANALKAREQAFEQAQVKAFEELAGRLLEETVFATFKAPPAQTISMMIQDFEVNEEKIASKRYSGTYIFRFRRSTVDKYLSIQAPPPQMNAPMAEGSMPQDGTMPATPAVPENSQYPYQAQEYTPPPSAPSSYAYGVQPPMNGAAQQSYSARVVFSSLAEWTSVQRALARVYGLNDIVLKALSPREAYIDLVFQGDVQRLQMALAQAGLALRQPSVQNTSAGTLVYELSLTSAISGPAAGTAGTNYQGRF